MHTYMYNTCIYAYKLKVLAYMCLNSCTHTHTHTHTHIYTVYALQCVSALLLKKLNTLM